MSPHCANLSGDREVGAYWEREFCKLAARYGRSFTAHQIGREKSAVAWVRSGGAWNSWTLPDITLWTRPGEHHEIKHKDPCSWGFGLERYRLEALRAFWEETGQSVYYTLHDYSRQPDSSLDYETQRRARKENPKSIAEHWVTAPVSELISPEPREEWGYSYVGGVKKRVPICYWPSSLFQPVVWLWRHEVARDIDSRLVSVQEASKSTH
jgi:hypothetical protein